MKEVIIDISNVVNEYYLDSNETKSLSRYILDRVTDDFLRSWENRIDNTLFNTRLEYKKGIKIDFIDDFTVEIGLTPRQSKLALMLENGASPFDMKKGFRGSKKAIHGEGNDWYLTIPFRHATPQALAETGFSTVLPRPVYNLAKSKKRALRLVDLPDKTIGFRPEIKLANNEVIPKYDHKHHIYEGLIRKNIAASNKEKRGGYFTFRRVSNKSDELSWIHKGFKPKYIFKSTHEQFDFHKITDIAIDEFLINGLL